MHLQPVLILYVNNFVKVAEEKKLNYDIETNKKLNNTIPRIV